MLGGVSSLRLVVAPLALRFAFLVRLYLHSRSSPRLLIFAAAHRAMAQPHAPALRSLYRRLLRELPSRQPSLLANPSPIHRRIRSQFMSSASDQTELEEQEAVTEQLVQYLRAQRLHTALLERYNPGMNMNEEDRVRLTARRVGMDLPEEFRK